jgi:Zn-dependent metalloprotease
MKTRLALALTLSCVGVTAFAQNNLRVLPGKSGMYPAYVSFATGAEPDFIPGTVLLQQQDAFVPSTVGTLLHSEADQLGMEHLRYQQKINNIPVEGSVYIVHVSGGKVKSENGEWIASVPAGLATTPAVSEAAALQAAVSAFGAKSYKWQLPAEEAFIKKESGNPNATFKPTAELVYYSGEQEISGDKLQLAWKLDLYAQQPTARRIYFIDATSGKVLGMRELLHTTNTSGTAVTAYCGAKTIAADQMSATSFRLQETTRGNGIATFNLNKGTTYSAATDFNDSDNYWNNVNTNMDQYATDAHWGAEMTYDYYKNTFNRNSINNAGYAINSYVHYSTNYFNAFWDGSRMTYGDGSATDNYKPLTSLDVCGHEITHGLTSFTAALNYSNESGALNEGFSDIFGTTIEFYAKPATANWLIGEDFYTIRSMSNPKAYGQPNTYQGVNWATGTSDYGGVHTNSGVLNYWYYLLTNGGSGTNDKAFSYSFTGIGLSKAAAIAYRTLTVYLSSSSQYANARTYSIQAATDLYGASSAEVTAVTNAWNAVGVTGMAPAPSCSDNYESNETRSAAKAISLNTDISAKIGSTTDKDWFAFTTTSAAPKLKVTLINLPANYNLTLYKSNGQQLAISQNTGTTSESISYNASNSGATYYVQVAGYNGAYNTASCYTLRVATSNVNQLIDEEQSSLDATLTGGIASANNELNVFPNPAKDKLMVSFNADDAGTATLNITDITGRVLMHQELDVMAGPNEVTVPLSNYMPGIYFLHVTDRQAAKFQVMQ